MQEPLTEDHSLGAGLWPPQDGPQARLSEKSECRQGCRISPSADRQFTIDQTLLKLRQCGEFAGQNLLNSVLNIG